MLGVTPAFEPNWWVLHLENFTYVYFPPTIPRGQEPYETFCFEEI